LLRANVRPSWGKRDVTSITRQTQRAVVRDRRACAVPANRTRSILVKLFGWAYDSALIDNNPMLGVRKPHRESKGKTRVLRDDELKVVWRASIRPELHRAPLRRSVCLSWASVQVKSAAWPLTSSTSSTTAALRTGNYQRPG
jgi:hypothetical protein